MRWGNKGKSGGDAGGSRAGEVSFDTEAPPVGDSSVADEMPTDVIDAEDDHSGEGPAAAPGVVDRADDEAASGDFAPATSRFGRRSGPKEPKAPKAAKVKVAKVRKAKGVEKSVEDYPMPAMMVISFYEGLVKEREAEQLGRALIEKNFDAPNASYVYTQKWRNGIAVEVQEGGGQAYLPEILQKLDEDPGAVIAVPMSNRIAQVRLDSETGRLEMLLLLNNQEPPADSFVPLPSKAMKPFDRRGSRLFIAGIALLASSFAASLFAVGAFFIDTEAWALPYVQQTEVKTVPMSQLTQMNEAAARGDCLYKMEFAGGQWTMTTGYDTAGKCGTQRTTPVPAAEPGPEVLPGGLPSSDGVGPGSVPTGPAVLPAAVPGASSGTVPTGPSAAPGVPAGAVPPVSGPQPVPIG